MGIPIHESDACRPGPLSAVAHAKPDVINATKETKRASPNAEDKGFIAWVGTYDDIKQGTPGQYRVSLLKTFKDGFYPGLHLLSDGTIVATTYANYRKEDVGCSIVSIRFKMSEVDALANP